MPRLLAPALTPLQRRLRLPAVLLAALVIGSAIPSRPAADALAQTRQMIADAARRAASPRLAHWILQQRDALAAGGKPLPSEIRGQLTPFFPGPVLDRARFRIGWPEGPTGAVFQLSGCRAMALDYLIVFRDPSQAADPVMWAHELAHVRQYEQWGITGFSERYLRDHTVVEAEAWQVASDYKMWALETGRIK